MSDRSPIDVERLRRATAGDEGALKELLQIFVEQVDERLAALTLNLRARDFAAIGEDAHSIKGASANVGADRLREIASSLEARMKNGERDRAEELAGEVSEEYARVRAFIIGGFA